VTPWSLLLLIVWLFVLVVVWPFELVFTGMAFEGGRTANSYFFVATVWSYPLSIVISVLLRKRHWSAPYLPAIPLLYFVLAAHFNW
jgi:hypothetical protein